MVGFFRSIHIPIGLLASHDLAVRPVVEEKKVGWEWGVQDRAYLGCVPSSDRPFVGSSVRPSMRLSVRPLVRTYVPPCVRPSVTNLRLCIRGSMCLLAQFFVRPFLRGPLCFRSSGLRRPRYAASATLS